MTSPTVPAGDSYFAGAVAWGVLVVLGGTAIALLKQPRRRAVLATALVAIDSLVLFAVPESSAPRAVQIDAAPPRSLKMHLGVSRAFTLGPLAPNYGAYYSVGLLNVNDVPVPSDLTRYIHTRLDPVVNPEIFVGSTEGGRPPFAPTRVQELLRNLDAYRAAAVQYVLAPAGQPLPESVATFRLVDVTPTTRIYRLAGSLPYFDAGPGCNVQSEGRQAARVTCARAISLVRRETYMPGWTAAVDGTPRPVRRVDGLFQTVTVPAGDHRITFEFTPPLVGWGYLCFAAGVLALLLPAAATPVQRRWATSSW